MRRGVIIILAVAIIGILGIYAGGRKDKPSALGAGSGFSAGNPGAASGTGGTADYKDGTYTGDAIDSPYGTVQVGAVVAGGKITDVDFLQMPSDRGHTQEVTAFSEPLLKQDTLKKQSAHIDFVSGATTTSEAYEQSLQSALDKAATS
ncbi:MAG TPA: FMN-binding protein [Candidatus Saccharimonadales bacterium]|nr:FMN-binding protein [Candidatus Saccharimonadales bacterium]